MKVGFIGFGEAAYNLAFGLGKEGIGEIRAYDVMMEHEVMGKQIHARAREARVKLEPSAVEIAKWAEIIFVAVPSFSTLDVCRSIKDALNENQFYVDVSASTPTVKKQCWELVKSSGVLFVDAAMMGSLPKEKHKVPIIVSGNGAKRFEEMMSSYGMKISQAGENAPVGAASAIKLIRSIYMKGIAALMIEMLQAADAYGVSEQVISSIAASMDGTPFKSHLERLVTGTAIHCTRRAAELKGSIEMLHEAGLGSEMTEAAKIVHEKLQKFNFATRHAERKLTGWQEVIDEMREIK